MSRKFFLSLFFILLFHAAVNAEKLYPVDEAAKDASFKKFRDKLVLAAQKKDAKFILSILHENIVNSFGGNDGVQGFKELWSPASKDTGLWKTLYDVLAMGGSFEMFENKKTFCAPYVFSKWPKDFDAFDYVAVTGKNVKAREKPSMDGTVLEFISYELIKKDPKAGNSAGEWIKVKTPSGKTGYVSQKFVRSPIDYRACFKKVKGQWRMTVFVAGD